MYSEYDLRVLCTRSLVMEETASMVSKDLRGCAFVVVHDSERTGKRLLCQDFPFGRRPAFLEGSVLDSINDEILDLYNGSSTTRRDLQVHAFFPKSEIRAFSF